MKLPVSIRRCSHKTINDDDDDNNTGAAHLQAEDIGGPVNRCNRCRNIHHLVYKVTSAEYDSCRARALLLASRAKKHTDTDTDTSHHTTIQRFLTFPNGDSVVIQRLEALRHRAIVRNNNLEAVHRIGGVHRAEARLATRSPFGGPFVTARSQIAVRRVDVPIVAERRARRQFYRALILPNHCCVVCCVYVYGYIRLSCSIHNRFWCRTYCSCMQGRRHAPSPTMSPTVAAVAGRRAFFLLLLCKTSNYVD
jgi:hypothetical protein